MIEDLQNKNTLFFICELDICNNENITVEVIIKYINNEVAIKDMYEELGQILFQPTIKLKNHINIEHNKILSGYYLTIPCSCGYDKTPIKWICIQCEQLFKYEYNGYIYCECGETKLEHCEFRCNNKEHGYKYIDFNLTMKNYIPKKPMPGDENINILLLGETGVGKSTFINALANYLRYDTFEEAEVREITELIYYRFKIMYNNEMIDISVGKNDNNENERTTSSNTQYCTPYRFPYKEKIITIIDTPGIGDTRGIQQDKINFMNILNHINNYNKLNGICILLKPNNARLTITFEFCIKELLKHLHKNAKDNILFLFPNSRSALYSPGDTYQPLSEFIETLYINSKIKISLTPNTMFCFDNESFRFLAALKKNLIFSEDVKKYFSKSWVVSSKELKRLIDHIITLPPHKTKDTITVNNVRHIILSVSHPLAEIAYNIETEIDLLKRKEKEMKTLDSNIDDLETRLMTPYLDLKSITLEEPRTVCTASKCVEIVNNVPRHLKHCHPTCYLDNVDINVKGHPDLQYCDAINTTTGKCNYCECEWAYHMHVLTDYVTVQKEKKNR